MARLRKPQLTDEELQWAGILLDPVAFAAAFMRSLDAPIPDTPLVLWPHQQEDVRDTHELIVHKDGRAVGKTVNITVLILHDGCTSVNGRTLVTTPNDGHLMKIIEEVEDQIFDSDFLTSMIAVDPRTGRLDIKRKPYYQIRWKNGTITYFRPAGPNGKSVRSLHCGKIFVDEAAWYPEAGWRALRRVLNKGGQMRVYSNPNGLRTATYYRLTQPGSGAKVYHWPSWIVPFWTEEDTEREARFYGGRDTAGFQHEVAGEHGAPSYTAFNHRQFKSCQRKLDKLYHVVRIDGEEFSAITSVDEAIPRIESLLDDVLDSVPKGVFWLGADLGYTNDPSEMIVLREDDAGRLIPYLRVHNEHVPYTYQAAMIALLDDFFDFAGLGIDAGSNGRSVEHILTTEDRYRGHQFEYRLEAYDFGSSVVIGYDDQGQQKTRNAKEYMTSLINGRLVSRKILFPTDETDLDWEDQFLTHTYSHTTSGRLLYSKGNDHIIDGVRAGVLRCERAQSGQLDLDGDEDVEFVMPVMTGDVFS